MFLDAKYSVKRVVCGLLGLIIRRLDRKNDPTFKYVQCLLNFTVWNAQIGLYMPRGY